MLTDVSVVRSLENRLKKVHLPAQFRDFDYKGRTEVANVQPRIPRSFPRVFPRHSAIAPASPGLRIVENVGASGQTRHRIERFKRPIGVYTTISGSPFANSGSRNFTTPGNNGTGTNAWVLVLETAGAEAKNATGSHCMHPTNPCYFADGAGK